MNKHEFEISFPNGKFLFLFLTFRGIEYYLPYLCHGMKYDCIYLECLKRYKEKGRRMILRKKLSLMIINHVGDEHYFVIQYWI